MCFFSSIQTVVEGDKASQGAIRDEYPPENLYKLASAWGETNLLSGDTCKGWCRPTRPTWNLPNGALCCSS